LGAVPHTISGTLDKALAEAARDAGAANLQHPVVLLSPACASYDQFPNFEVRGDTFRSLVRSMVR
jgi:UDP-N-acetylmuramoylalanine--D-glutamate ligase